jgi:hypothetical protein
MVVRKLVVSAGVLIAVAAGTAGVSSAAATNSQGRVAGTAYVEVIPPYGLRAPGHPTPGHPYTVRGVVVTLRTPRGTLMARQVTTANGRFSFAVAPGVYVFQARVGPPTSTPGKNCGPPRGVQVVKGEQLRPPVVCLLG